MKSGRKVSCIKKYLELAVHSVYIHTIIAIWTVIKINFIKLNISILLGVRQLLQLKYIS